MTEYELIDALNSSQEAAVSASMAFVTISSAYAIAIHLIGKSLPSLFLWGIAGGYSIYGLMPALGVFRASNEMLLLLSRLEAFREGTSVQAESPVAFNLAILIFIWGMCIAYTIYVRRDT